MSKVLVTGASGFLGSNLVQVLLAAGHEVVATKRTTSRIDHLSDFNIHWKDAALEDLNSLIAAFKDADAVFHCAAVVSYWHGDSAAMCSANVQGTHNVIEAVRQAKVKRLIYCSSVDALGLPEKGSLGNEESVWNWDQHGFDFAYPRTKFESEKLVLAARDINAVIVNPTFMLGPNDPKPSSGRLTLSVAKGWGLAYPSGKNNFVDVRDVCSGMLLAWQKGKRGERYILGGENLSYAEVFSKIAKVAGVRRPIFAIPKVLAQIGGLLGDAISLFTRKDPSITSQSTVLSYIDHVYSSEKARLDLDYQSRSIEHAIEDSLTWFKDYNYL
ncbi:MAG: SDR family oxidoreductase [Bdellovibrionota bacterium]